MPAQKVTKTARSGSSSNKFNLLIITILIILAGFFVGVNSDKTLPFLKNLSFLTKPFPTITPTPTAIPTVIPDNLRPLPTGPQEYSVSSKDSKGPAVSKLIIDPLAIEKGTTQTVSLTAADKNPVTGVRITLITDNKSVPYDLKLVEGTPTEGKWQSTWTIDDAIYFKYQMIVEATSATGITKFQPIFR